MVDPGTVPTVSHPLVLPRTGARGELASASEGPPPLDGAPA
jgi:hypothetical protein